MISTASRQARSTTAGGCASAPTRTSTSPRARRAGRPRPGRGLAQRQDPAPRRPSSTAARAGGRRSSPPDTATPRASTGSRAPTALVSTSTVPTATTRSTSRKGANYGWPTVDGEQTEGGLVGPEVVYPESIAPVGGHLRAQARVGLDRRLPGRRAGGRAAAAPHHQPVGQGHRNEALFEGEFGRLRTVVEGPDGSLYVLTNNRDGRGSPKDGDDRILRIVPPAG